MYLMASNQDPLNPEHKGKSLLEFVEMQLKTIEQLRDNALRESNMWPRGFNGEYYGPHDPPPSTWPLDHVPDQIIDSIVDAVSDDARFRDHKHHEKCGCKGTKFWSNETAVYPWVPFTPTVKFLAWVDKAFRDNIFTRKLVPALCLCSSFTLFQADKYINLKYYPHVKQIVITPYVLDNGSQYCSGLQDFIQKLPNIDCIFDGSKQIAVYGCPMPEKMFNVTLRVSRINHELEPIPVKEIRMLQIHSTPDALNESGVDYANGPDLNNGLGTFASKVTAIAKNIKKITNLQLKVPGMITCGCSHTPRMPAWKCLKDPVPKHFPTLEVLDLYVPFCLPTPGFYREAQWWGYLEWLLTTPAKFQALQIHFEWSPKYIPWPRASARDISHAMGVELPPEARYGWQERIRRKMPTFLLEPTLENFIRDIYARHPELKMLQLVYKARMSDKYEPELYRLVYSHRNPSGDCLIIDQLEPCYGDLVKESLDLVQGGELKRLSDCYLYNTAEYAKPPKTSKFDPEMNLMAPLGLKMEDGFKFFGHNKEDFAEDYYGRADISDKFLDANVKLFELMEDAKGHRKSEARFEEVSSEEEE